MDDLPANQLNLEPLVPAGHSITDLAHQNADAFQQQVEATSAAFSSWGFIILVLLAVAWISTLVYHRMAGQTSAVLYSQAEQRQLDEQRRRHVETLKASLSSQRQSAIASTKSARADENHFPAQPEPSHNLDNEKHALTPVEIAYFRRTVASQRCAGRVSAIATPYAVSSSSANSSSSEPLGGVSANDGVTDVGVTAGIFNDAGDSMNVRLRCEARAGQPSRVMDVRCSPGCVMGDVVDFIQMALPLGFAGLCITAATGNTAKLAQWTDYDLRGCKTRADFARAAHASAKRSATAWSQMRLSSLHTGAPRVELLVRPLQTSTTLSARG